MLLHKGLMECGLKKPRLLHRDETLMADCPIFRNVHDNRPWGVFKMSCYIQPTDVG